MPKLLSAAKAKRYMEYWMDLYSVKCTLIGDRYSYFTAKTIQGDKFEYRVQRHLEQGDWDIEVNVGGNSWEWVDSVPNESEVFSQLS